MKYAAEKLRSDRTVVLAAVRNNTAALRYASDELRGDREVVREAVKRNMTLGVRTTALEYASEELRNDRDIVLEAVRVNADALEHVSDKLRADREIALAAVRQDTDALRRYYTSEMLHGDVRIRTEAWLRSDFLLLLYPLIPVALFLIGWETAAVLTAPFCFYIPLSSILQLILTLIIPSPYVEFKYDAVTSSGAERIIWEKELREGEDPGSWGAKLHNGGASGAFFIFWIIIWAIGFYLLWA